MTSLVTMSPMNIGHKNKQKQAVDLRSGIKIFDIDIDKDNNYDLQNSDDGISENSQNRNNRHYSLMNSPAAVPKARRGGHSTIKIKSKITGVSQKNHNKKSKRPRKLANPNLSIKLDAFSNSNHSIGLPSPTLK